MGYKKELRLPMGFKNIEQKKAFLKAAKLSSMKRVQFARHCFDVVLNGKYDINGMDSIETIKEALQMYFENSKNTDDSRKAAVAMAQLGLFKEAEEMNNDLDFEMNYN